mgnify:CR=1 FL=1
MSASIPFRQPPGVAEAAGSVSEGTNRRVVLGTDRPMRLDCGVELSNFTVAYSTFGTLNADRSNAVMVCHALTGDHFVTDYHPVSGKPGWWSMLVGPGRPIDTDRYFVICSNVIGGCMGSTGPASLNPATGKVWGLDFPIITIPDMVRAQALLLDHLGVGRLKAVVGGSMGGMQAYHWAARYPDLVERAAVVCGSARCSPYNYVFLEGVKAALTADPAYRDGRFVDKPTAGLRAMGRVYAGWAMSHEFYREEIGRAHV